MQDKILKIQKIRKKGMIEMEFLKALIEHYKDEREKYVRKFFLTGDKNLLKEIKNIDMFLYVNGGV